MRQQNQQQEVHPLDVLVAFVEKAYNKDRITYSDTVMVNKAITEMATLIQELERLRKEKEMPEAKLKKATESETDKATAK